MEKDAPMWKKDSPEPQRSDRSVGADRTPSNAPSCIGASITLKGDVSGAEDLVIEGRVEGDVRLDNYSVTVGAPGHMIGNVFAEVIIVEGEVIGNLTAARQLILTQSGAVEGDLNAPRVTLHDGCSFQGRVEMPEAKPQRAPEKSKVKDEPRDHKAVPRAAAQPA